MNIRILLLLLFITTISSAQPNIEWQYSLGGTESEGLGTRQFIKTTDGGYIFVGNSNSIDGDVSGHHGSTATSDCWVVKLDSLGNIEWDKSLGGTGDEEGDAILQTSDGGYVIIATATSTDGDVTGYHVDTVGMTGDVWMIKLDSTGTIEWQNCFGGFNSDAGRAVIESYDGNYIALANSASNDGDVTGNHGGSDIWILKVSSTGTLLWQKSLGGSGEDFTSSIKETPDSGFVIVGNANSTDGDFSSAVGNAITSAYLMKVDSLGNFQWVKNFGGNSIDFGLDVNLTPDGGYFLLNSTLSSDIPGNHGVMDGWLLKLDDTGNIQWQKCYGGSGYDQIRDIAFTADNGLLLISTSNSADGDVSSNFGGFDAWVAKTDSLGNIEWEHSYGGTDQDNGYCLALNPDGSIVLAASTNSNDMDVSGHHGATTTSDIWIVKLQPLISGLNDNPDALKSMNLYPNPTSDQVVLSFDLKHSENVRIELVDISGRIIARLLDEERFQGLNTTTIDLHKLSIEVGMYFINTTVGQTGYTRKLIKH